PVETTKFSAQEYAENFAKETDPAEYAKDFSYQPSVESSEPVTSFDDYKIESPKEDVFSNYDSTSAEALPTVESENFASFVLENGKAEQAFETFNQPIETTQPAETFTAPVETFTQPVEAAAPPVSSTPPKTRLSE